MACCCGGAEQHPTDARSIESALPEFDREKVVKLREDLEIDRAPRPVPRALSKIVFTPVHLNVYHLIDPKVNVKLEKIGFGLFHTGVEVHGYEWSFGEAVEPGQQTGLFCVGAMQAMTHFYKRLYLGETTYSPEQIDTILHRMENEWKSAKYHVLHKNCNHFAKYFCKKLSTVTPLIVPDCYNRAANWSDVILPKRFATWMVRKFDDAPPRAIRTAASDEPSRIAHLPSSIIPTNWYKYHHIRRDPQFVIVPSSKTSTLREREPNANGGPDGPSPAGKGGRFTPVMPDFNAGRDPPPRPNVNVVTSRVRDDRPTPPPHGARGSNRVGHLDPADMDMTTTHAREMQPGAVQSPAAGSSTPRRSAAFEDDDGLGGDSEPVGCGSDVEVAAVRRGSHIELTASAAHQRQTSDSGSDADPRRALNLQSINVVTGDDFLRTVHKQAQRDQHQHFVAATSGAAFEENSADAESGSGAGSDGEFVVSASTVSPASPEGVAPKPSGSAAAVVSPMAPLMPPDQSATANDTDSEGSLHLYSPASAPATPAARPLPETPASSPPPPPLPTATKEEYVGEVEDESPSVFAAVSAESAASAAPAIPHHESSPTEGQLPSRVLTLAAADDDAAAAAAIAAVASFRSRGEGRLSRSNSVSLPELPSGKTTPTSVK